MKKRTRNRKKRQTARYQKPTTYRRTSRRNPLHSILALLLFLIGLAGAVWFLLPFAMHRILNIGNLTGLMVCAILMIYGCFWKRINKSLGKLWKKSFGKVLLSAVGAGAAAILILVIVETGFMVTAASRQPAENATLIVLGAKAKGEKPSLILRKRLDAAYDYLMENPESACILSGGQGSDEIITEAECMYRYLTEKGIPSERLYKEENSTSTRENLAYSMEIIQNNQLNSNIAIATNEFHEYRAGKIAEDLGLDYSAVPGHTPAYLFATYYVRELYGILYEWIL